MSEDREGLTMSDRIRLASGRFRLPETDQADQAGGLHDPERPDPRTAGLDTDPDADLEDE